MRAATVLKLDLIDLAVFLRQFYRGRHEEGYSYQDLASYTGVPATTFSMWLSGKRGIVKVATLQKLLVGYQQWART